MNFIKSKKIAWLSTILVVVVILFSSTITIYCMEGLIEGSEVGLEAGAREAALEAAEKTFGTAEELGAEDLAQMREGFQEDLKAQVNDALESIKSDLAKDPTLEVGSEQFNEIVDLAFKEAKSNFLNNIAKSTEMSVQDVSALEKMKFAPEEMSAINKLPVEGFEMVNVPEGMSEVVSDLPETSELSVAHDEVMNAQNDLQEAYKSSNKTKITEAEGKLKTAQERYAEQAKTTKEASASKAETATRDEIEAKNNLEKAKKAGNPDEIKTAQDEVTTKEQAAKEAKTANEETLKKQANEDYQQKKAAKATADEELNTAKNVYGKNSEEAKAAQEKVTEAQTELDAAKKNLLENTGYLENKGLRLAETAKSSLGGFWSGTQASASVFWTYAGQSFVGGFLFTFPNMIMDSIESYYRNKGLLDTLEKVQKFGNIYMRIPDWLINSEEPANSKHVYVGLPNADQPLTSEFLKTANYYVAKPDYGELGAYAITDPNFPNVMVHLNTGFIFVGDGQPFDPQKIAMPLLVAGKEGDLVNALQELAGQIKNGAEGKVYQYYQIDRSTGYKGNPDVGDLFVTPKGALYPALLSPTITALQNGTQFGNYALQAIRGLGGSNPDDQAMLNLLTNGVKVIGAPDEPYVAKGIYIYQTKDTPFIKNIRNSLAPDDPDQQIVLKELVDYVIMLDDEANVNKVLPLMVPQAEPPYNYASYVLNNLEGGIKYMLSLIDGTLYTSQKPTTIKHTSVAIKDIPTIFPGIDQILVQQIGYVQEYCQQHATKGPFNYGSVNLTIDQKLLDGEIFVYKAAKYLEGGIDDYVVALKGSTAIQLPSTDVQLFVSLVTSRFYDASFKPYQPPAYKATTYHVATMASDKKGPYFVTTGNLTSKMAELYSSTAPLYTLFVEYPFNPNKPPAGTNASGDQLKTAFPAQWALNNLKMGAGEKALSISKYLDANKPSLKTTILASHDAWIKTLDKNDPALVSKQMGPFDFTTDQVHNVQLTAVSEDAIKNQNFVYVSDSYPGEFLVLSEDSQGKSRLGESFGSQQYAISLSNGTVYDSNPQPDAGKLSGEKIEQDPLPVDQLLAKSQTASRYLPDLLKKIQDSQVVYNGSLRHNLSGPNVGFGRFKFYITKADYLAGQFIYADVTNLGEPLDDKGNEIAAVVSKINDYYVCVVRTPDKSQPDGYAYSFGDKISGDTYSVVSLISGASYDRTGKYLGSYEQFSIKGSSVTNILEFTNKTLGIIATKSGKPVRLMSTITKLTDEIYQRILKEAAQIKKDEDDQKKIYTALGGDLKTNLDSTSLPYIDNPNLLPRYLKKYQNKYYGVTPGYIFSTPPSKDTPLDTPGPDRIYVDYDIGQVKNPVTGKMDDAGMMYDNTGKAMLLLKGWALANARAYAGIVVEKDGKQQRMIGVTAPTIPMTGPKTPTSPTGDFMVPTGFKTIKAGDTTFDFYYHTQIDSYFVKVSTTSQQYYVNLTSGYGYNLDGTPRWFESPMFKDKENNLLLVGTDAFDIRKVALRKPTLPGQPVEPFNFYTMVGGFKATLLQDYKAQGSYYEMINDADPDQRIRLMLADKDLQGLPLQTPYYLVWDLSNKNKFQLIGQYFQNDLLRYSLLLYAQTRTKGSSVESGRFVASDNYIDPTAPNPKPKTVGILFDKDHTMEGVFYQNQICMLKGGLGTYIKTDPTTGAQTSHSIVVTINSQNIQPQEKSEPVLQARWVTIDDGGNSYDYMFDTLILNSNHEVSSGEISAKHLNLYDLKNTLWNLNVTSFIATPDPSGKTDHTKPISGTALVSRLNATMSPGSVKFPPGIADSLKEVANNSAGFINADKSGFMFINNRVSGNVVRFAYQLGSAGDAQDTNPNYYAPSLNGWFVDISNGILYDSSGFPSGRALMPAQLDALLDTLQLSVGYECDAATKVCTPKLQYKMVPKATKTLK